MEHANQAAQDVHEEDRRRSDRRSGERRTALDLGGRRLHEDRRRNDRRVRMAGAGLLAAVAFAVGGHEVASRMDGRSFGLPEVSTSEPSSSVDVATDFHLPAWDKEALEPIIQEAATLHGLSPSLI